MCGEILIMMPMVSNTGKKAGYLDRIWLVAVQEVLRLVECTIVGSLCCWWTRYFGINCWWGTTTKENHQLSSKENLYSNLFVLHWWNILFELFNFICQSKAYRTVNYWSAIISWIALGSGIEQVGVKGLASLINAAILSSAFSCGNAFFIVPQDQFIVLHWQAIYPNFCQMFEKWISCILCWFNVCCIIIGIFECKWSLE